MNRKRSMVLLCHCILNANAKVEGLAGYAGALRPLVDYLVAAGYGLVQLPCPELTMCGCRRWGQVKEQYDTPYFRRHCRQIFQPVMDQITDYIAGGYSFPALIGIDGSPSCGASMTCSSPGWGGEMGGQTGLKEIIDDVRMVPASGVFIEELTACLRQAGVQIELLAVDESDPVSSVATVINILEKGRVE
jgi:predicted secreted protein